MRDSVCEKVSMHLVNNILVGGLRNSSDADDGWIVDETPMIGRRARGRCPHVCRAP
jgi:hypothetical protein